MSRLFMSVCVTVFIFLQVQAQGTLSDYQRAEKFLWRNVEKLLYNEWVSPNFIGEGEQFWYSVRTRRGTEYFMAHAKTATKTPLFDHEKLAEMLSKNLDKEIEPYALPLKSVKCTDDGKYLKFGTDDKYWKLNLESMELKPVSRKAALERTESKSPDEKWIAFLNDHNIYMRNKETGEEKQLTTDGVDKYAYGESISWYSVANEAEGAVHDIDIDVMWSPDSKKLMITRYDWRNVEKLYLYKSKPEEGFRAEVYSYFRPIAGDSSAIMREFYVYDLETESLVKADLPPIATFLHWGGNWLQTSDKFYLQYYSRGFYDSYLVEVDATTGKSRTIIHETTDTYIEPGYLSYRVIEENNEVLWTSERDGWNHLYLYDYASGKLKKQLTSGNYFVRSIVDYDTKAQKVYFMASGREQGRDPYYQHYYSVGFNGKGVQLLSTENAEHSISMSSNKQYAVDNYSSYKQPNMAVLREAKTGRVLLQLEEEDADDLYAMNWKAPETFVVKGRDGKTDIYGSIFLPTNYDSTKLYPVIDGTYSGPHTIRSPKTFRRCAVNMDQALAELGFIVVTVDGFGSAYRSKAFHDVSYKNLGDAGQPDHILAIKELAKRYGSLDTTRVGIYGHSAGGYDAARALLANGHFYSVGVASAGNHDHRIAKAWWPELYMGFPAGDNYDEQSNFTHVENLNGYLLLAHGDMDQNVNPSGSVRFMAECVKANRDVDLLLVPGVDHGGLYFDKYFIRKRWDYFVRHLMGVEPPRNYKIE